VSRADERGPVSGADAGARAAPDAPAVDAQVLAERVVYAMLAADAFTRWLSAEVVETAPRRSVLRMRVRDDMVNGLGTCHGGVTYALADSAFAFACNTHGRVAVALDVAASYPTPARPGDVLTAVAEADAGSRRVGFYRVTVSNARGEPVLLFRGTAYDTGTPHAATADAATPAPPGGEPSPRTA
jgi:acyl-CoA thioesterase